MRVRVGVTMMHIGVVWMPMHQPDVLVLVGMRLTGRIVRRMIVLVVFVVPVPVFMLHVIMKVVVCVDLGQMQPKPRGHQRARHQ